MLLKRREKSNCSLQTEQISAPSSNVQSTRIYYCCEFVSALRYEARVVDLYVLFCENASDALRKLYENASDACRILLETKELIELTFAVCICIVNQGHISFAGRGYCKRNQVEK